MAYQYEFKDEIIGKRIILKKLPVTFDMAHTLFNLIDSSRDCLGIFLPWVDKTTKAEHSFSFLISAADDWKNKTKAQYGIFNRETQEYMGIASVIHFNEFDSAEIGYWLGTRFQGKGYMQEAVRLLENAFLPHLIRLVIRNDVKNQRSAHVAEKLGYHKDGVMRSAIKYVDGHYGDINVWTKLRSEWETKQSV